MSAGTAMGLSRLTARVPKNVVISGGKPDNDPVVNKRDRILFRNDDTVGYVIELQIPPLAVDHFLPALGSVMVFVSPNAVDGTYYYGLLPATEDLLLPSDGDGSCDSSTSIRSQSSFGFHEYRFFVSGGRNRRQDHHQVLMPNCGFAARQNRTESPFVNLGMPRPSPL